MKNYTVVLVIISALVLSGCVVSPNPVGQNASNQQNKPIETNKNNTVPKKEPVTTNTKEKTSIAENVKDVNDGFDAYDAGNYSKAANLFSRACTNGDGEGCASLAGMYESGEGVKKDKAKASALNKRAVAVSTSGCDAGVGAACNYLANLYNWGSLVKKNIVKSINLYEKACNAGDSMGCNNAGHHYLEGKGVKKNVMKGTTLALQSCTAGNGMGCFSAGTGFQQQKDHEKAKILFERGCALNYEDACMTLRLQPYNR